MTVITQDYKITWEKLPDDYKLPDDPVDNINQPALAAALTESLLLAEKIPANALATTNYGICATLNNKIVIKAPDWAFIAKINVNREEVIRSYTPQLQGDTPVIVMEFVSDTQETEYSIKSTYPPGKWFFYERILKVPNYIIFEPESGSIETYRLDTTQEYILQEPDANQRYWIPEINLYLGVLQGTRENRTAKWLRWWDEQGNLLPWGTELAEQERQRTEQERQRAERLAAQLRAAGIEPED
ncbi:MAG: Uma2 family endonuclease [Nostoc sp. GBBB01]|uniref:Uma2 family endonuclease n=1 Tax=Nostoc punctiforme FACHB-252 TaxID=1357509 RepID=A0ABR8H5F0_NOSPU|nr:Uma2 family endonuclease [Nostoc punctiforme]MBD2610613.1 Uma2 family endonuclease [Nostoc punctiforme FACHB-252]MBL1198392.1 Uma2 family endonuclease [Nostoc sp. GBBB01]